MRENPKSCQKFWDFEILYKILAGVRPLGTMCLKYI